MSCRAIRTTLFNEDGVSLTATTVTSSPTTFARAASGNDGDGDGNVDVDGDRRRESGIILTLALNRHGEKNVVNPDMVSLLMSALDAIDGHPASAGKNNKALIITGLALVVDDDDGGDRAAAVVDGPASKFFSNGLDLEWMMRANAPSAPAPAPDGGGINANDAVSGLIESFNSDVLARVLTLPFRTVAAINGHCIGAGLFLALACDYRIMRTERGVLQWPEARLGMRLTKGFAELSRAKVAVPGCDRDVLREGILGARRYSPTEAAAAGIVDAVHPLEALYGEAFRLAAGGLPLSPSGLNLEYFDPVAYTEMKIEMYTDAYRALTFGRVADPPHSRI
jgi:enoyl-CoA hydratase/carnithine racemase